MRFDVQIGFNDDDTKQVWAIERASLDEVVESVTNTLVKQGYTSAPVFITPVADRMQFSFHNEPNMEKIA